jgi:hypothetical protein
MRVPGRILSARLVQPLAALALLGAGAVLVAVVTSLIGSRDGGASHHAGNGGIWRVGHSVVMPLPQPASGAEQAFDAALAQLKAGPFGVELRPVTGSLTGSLRAPDGAHGEGEFEAFVLVDAAEPPLRVEIMGLLHSLDRAARAPDAGAGSP